MIKKLYAWTLSLAAHPKALWALAILSFLESSVFPIPPDILMVAMILSQPKRAFLIAGITLTASVIGGIFGYFIGAFLFDEVGYPILNFLGKGAMAIEFNSRFNNLGFWPVLIAGLTPIPYKIVTITSGWASVPLTTFIIASIISRGIRFFLVAVLLWLYGEKINNFIQTWMNVLFILFIIILIGGFGMLKIL
jgi:membrane protein YqaA with SNARE-associated domain|tara:strand:+ start:2911 stop:3489 length:579 start_codon:yes stop_codon:yes gene_type:complete